MSRRHVRITLDLDVNPDLWPHADLHPDRLAMMVAAYVVRTIGDSDAHADGRIPRLQVGSPPARIHPPTPREVRADQLDPARRFGR